MRSMKPSHSIGTAGPVAMARLPSVARDAGKELLARGLEVDQFVIVAEQRGGVGIMIVEIVAEAPAVRRRIACRLKLRDRRAEIGIAADEEAEMVEAHAVRRIGHPVAIEALARRVGARKGVGSGTRGSVRVSLGG